MKRIIATVDDDIIKNIEVLSDNQFMANRFRYKELLEKEEKLLDMEKAYEELRAEYSKLKIRYMQENLLKFEGGTPIDWACFHVTRFLNDYLNEHNVKDTDSITEKRIHTIAFAHALEDKLLDYIEKLEEFNND